MKLFLFLILGLVAHVDMLLHHLSIHNDDRTVFKIETFGFIEGGKMKVKISDFSLHFTAKDWDDYKQVESTTSHNQSSEVTLTNHVPKSTKGNHTQVLLSQTKINSPQENVNSNSMRRILQEVSKNITKIVSTQAQSSPKYLVGFVMRHASSESAAQADLESIIEKRQCILEHLQPNDVFIDLSDSESWQKDIELHHDVTKENIGLFSLIYARCYPSGHHFTSFKLDATFYNPGPNYLSAGDTPLPAMYFSFFALFTATLLVWVWVLRRDTTVYGPVHRIHYMMLILLILKCLSLFFEGVRYHYISLYGVSEGWSAVYYVFAFLKGIMLFTVILLIGSGWSLMKSYLNDQEKRIVWVVLVLQVLDNVAMIVLEESAPGSQGWLTWRDLLHLIDIVCCCAILLPIVWSIRHLRMAAEVDGKAHNSLLKLQLFRQFYVMVVIYVYFTRIVVYVVAATVPFYLLWTGPCATELATLLFFTITGYKFRPAVDNPYLPVRTEDSEAGEYGLDEVEEGGVQLQLPVQQSQQQRNKTTTTMSSNSNSSKK